MKLFLPAGVLALVLIGCAAGPDAPGTPGERGWPYASIAVTSGVPPELQGRPLFAGRWLLAAPDGKVAIGETSEPRYLAKLPFDAPRRVTFLDLGADALVENADFLEGGRLLVLVGAVTLPARSRAASSRAILQVDLETNLLVDSIALARDVFARGFAVDPLTRRAYLLHDDGAGNGTLQSVDLYGGGEGRRVAVGAIPSGVARKGLALGRNGRVLYCLIGGESARSDFEPVDPEPAEGPFLLVLDPETFEEDLRLSLDPEYTPRGVVADPDRDRAFVLETRGAHGRLLVIDSAFSEIGQSVDLPDQASDLAMADGIVHVACARGIYLIDPDRQMFVGGAHLPFEETGEIAVAPDGTRAFVQFRVALTGGGPGIALASLPTGGLVDVLQ